MSTNNLPSPTFSHTSEISSAMGVQGNYWFSANTMRFFGTTFPDQGIVYDGRYFITKERSRKDFTDRLCLVREVVVKADGRLDIVTHNSDGFKTAGQARNFIYALIDAKA